MLRRILSLLVAFPLGAALVAIAVSNRHPVQLILDPFRPETPALSVELPFYAYLLGASRRGWARAAGAARRGPRASAPRVSRQRPTGCRVSATSMRRVGKRLHFPAADHAGHRLVRRIPIWTD